MTQITASFEVTGWDQEPYEQRDGLCLSRAEVRKAFSGALTGSSVAQLLLAEAADGRGYVASELVTGELEGRSGTFVIQHGGVAEGDATRNFGHIVPGSGSGDLAGLRGEAAFAHDEQGARLTLTYEL
jgi:hypothetical protein